MNDFERISFDHEKAKAELRAYKTLLDQTVSLGEASHILPFFRKHKQFSALIGNLKAAGEIDCFAYEYRLFGDFIADLVVGNSKSGEYTIVEFEDGAPDSIFANSKTPFVRPWSKRFERGTSQLIDWLWKLDQQARTSSFSRRFGEHPVFYPVLVIGRDSAFSDKESRERFHWRTRKVVVNSDSLNIFTFDQLGARIERLVNSVKVVAGISF